MNKDNTAEAALRKMSSQVELCSEEVLFNIDSEGQWFYQNAPLPSKFARLFSGILKYIDQEYFLITPVEKVRVEVAAEPFKLVDYQLARDGSVNVTTSIGTEFHIESVKMFNIFDDKITCDLPNGLNASLNRACYYRYIEEFLA
ncbi:DUF1285 domain-containing protein [Parashewanella curva]|uniref:DUF1285 domain-containing protein n=1 Tax=Parashewanella curva TaxID=2338552 RepID=A0A3L8PUY7_9GAMM|nr:DUF1285 domain-containing protein [Parashewanella curva]RLV58393.1 DUF1285 domain-containing protein [Parashewanella curva]